MRALPTNVYRCPLCWKQGWPDHMDEPKCAFLANGKFTASNWNCGTMNKLRDDAESTGMCERYGDNSVALPRVPTGWVLLEFYKNRGRVDSAWFVGDGKPRHMKLDDLTREFEDA